MRFFIFILLTISLNANIKTCLTCHGQHFEKRALGKSKIVKYMNQKEIQKALEGYKKHIYGGPFRVIMEKQVRGIDTRKITKEIIKSSL